MSHLDFLTVQSVALKIEKQFVKEMVSRQKLMVVGEDHKSINIRRLHNHAYAY